MRWVLIAMLSCCTDLRAECQRGGNPEWSPESASTLFVQEGDIWLTWPDGQDPADLTEDFDGLIIQGPMSIRADRTCGRNVWWYRIHSDFMNSRDMQGVANDDHFGTPKAWCSRLHDAVSS